MTSAALRTVRARAIASTSAYRMMVTADRLNLQADKGSDCNAVSWVRQPGNDVTLPDKAIFKNSAWSVCFNSRGTIALVPSAPLTITDNDSSAPTTNPLDDPESYVRQHYYDFLGRLPDDGGLAFWINEITQCGSNTACINERRVAVSNAFFFEAEYQQTASYVFLLYRAAYGNDQPFPNPDFFDPNLSPSLKTETRKLPRYLSFVRDRAQVVGGSNLAQTQLALANAFVARPAVAKGLNIPQRN